VRTRRAEWCGSYLPRFTIGGCQADDRGHATSLLPVLEALDRHPGKRQQKITVQRVTVKAGGQAIVGNVEAGAGSAAVADDAAAGAIRPALTHDPAPLAPQFEMDGPAKSEAPAVSSSFHSQSNFSLIVGPRYSMAVTAAVGLGGASVRTR
jgi:hypothetical protein